MATRLDKLDYLALDQQLSRSFYDQLEQSLKPLEQNFNIFSWIKPEFRLILNGYLYFNSLFSDESTLGQKIYNLKTISTLANSNGTLNRLQVYSIGAITVLLPYIRERFSRSSLLNNKFTYLLEDVVKFGELINFMIFLQKGRHPYLLYRLLFLDCALIPGKKRIPLDFYLINRNLLWTSISEILSFLIQIVDFKRIGLIVKQQVTSKLTSSVKLSNEETRKPKDYRICAICDNWPNNPYHIGCKHIFCYFCIYSDFLQYGGSSYSCSQCGHKIDDISQMKQLYMSWTDV
ncbi:peroxisome biogenesis factor 2-like [Panonychus citri]|uniref:peroxisome biogenesis factor 2-like n=1 Tax=Panonychus citri TaxID=50023 RepID=UPI002307CFD7|nr:peroxisome biogenesis factor 2-like [Panonychus citri]